MKSSVAVGFIAGIVGAITSIVFAMIGGAIGIWAAHPGGIPTNMIASNFAVDVIFGIIFGVIYAMFYNSIPGKGVMKGLIFGMILYLICNIRAVAIFGSYAGLSPVNVIWAQVFSWVGFFFFITTGLVLGALYKKE